MRNRPKTTITAALAAATLLTVGCGAAADKAADKVAEEAIEQQTGGNVDIDTGDGSYSIETEDGSFSAGSGDLPESWPEDIPLPGDLADVVATDSQTPEGHHLTVTGTTATEPTDIKDAFAEAFDGWTVTAESTATVDGNDTVTAQWDGDGRQVMLLATVGDDGTTSITVAHTTMPG